MSVPPSIKPRAAPPEEMTAKAASARLRAASFGAFVVIRASTDGAASGARTLQAREVKSTVRGPGHRRRRRAWTDSGRS